MANGSGLLEQQANALKANFGTQFGGVAPKGLFPLYGSGARSYVRVAGTPIAVCQSFSWRVVADTSEIRTIDTNLPWDLVFNQISITANLSELMDPRGSLESQGLFHTIQSFIHQPFVEMQVLDAIGSNLFFARGAFVGMNGAVNTGQLSRFSVDFKGVAYQHNVFQQFKPYSNLGGAIGGALKGISGAISSLGGGFL